MIVISASRERRQLRCPPVLATLRWRLSFRIPQEAAIATATSMLFTILFGASVLSVAFRLMGGDNPVHEFLANLPAAR